MFLPSTITLKFGDSGDFVTELQRRLAAIRCYPNEAVNGFYDGVTVNAVSQFQTQCGLRADGIAGPETLRRLNGAIAGDSSASAGGTSGSSNSSEEEERRRFQLHQAQLQQEQQQWELEQARLASLSAAAATQHQASTTSTIEATPSATTTLATPPTATVPIPPEPGPATVGGLTQAVNYATNFAQTQNLAQAFTAPLQSPLPEAVALRAEAPTTTPPYAVPTQAAVAAGAKRAAAAPENLLEPKEDAKSPATEPRSLLHRAVGYANELIQKLSNYFESRLPRHVLSEVKEIGVVMAQNGVREIGIPMGPEPQLPNRSIETPGRAQPQQVPQRN